MVEFVIFMSGVGVSFAAFLGYLAHQHDRCDEEIRREGYNAGVQVGVYMARGNYAQLTKEDAMSEEERWDLPSERLKRIATSSPAPQFRKCSRCPHRHVKGERCGYPTETVPCKCVS